jgi:hypothetical protein
MQPTSSLPLHYQTEFHLFRHHYFDIAISSADKAIPYYFFSLSKSISLSWHGSLHYGLDTHDLPVVSLSKPSRGNLVRLYQLDTNTTALVQCSQSLFSGRSYFFMFKNVRFKWELTDRGHGLQLVNVRSKIPIAKLDCGGRSVKERFSLDHKLGILKILPPAFHIVDIIVASVCVTQELILEHRFQLLSA